MRRLRPRSLPTCSAALLLALAACGMTADDGGLADMWPRAPWHAGERHDHVGENPFVPTSTTSVATFGLDVDTAGHALIRRDLVAGWAPHPDAVRVEDSLNYFSYDYPRPSGADTFALDVEVAPSPFGDGLHLLRVGVQGRQVERRGRANVVFLVDVSASMAAPDKLPLVQETLRQLLDALGPNDRLALVVYAGSVGTLLDPTPAAEREVILEAIGKLTTGGSTWGEGGIRAAYALAERHFDPQGINRVVLATDGDFNVGLYGEPLIEFIEEKRQTGIYLTTLGFGRGDYDGALLERLAHHGNGNHAYIDGPGEAARVVGRDLLTTLVVVAEDAKVQVEFEPMQVRQWRLLGYENRVLGEADFRDDRVDTGDVGAGASVTALLEIELVNGTSASTASLAQVRLRWRDPSTRENLAMSRALFGSQVVPDFAEASDTTRFAAAVAEFAEILRGSTFSEGRRFEEVRAILEPLVGDDPDKQELLDLVDRAAELQGR